MIIGRFFVGLRHSSECEFWGSEMEGEWRDNPAIPLLLNPVASYPEILR